MNRRPAIAHLFPWQLTTGGAQRFLFTLASAFSTFCDVYIIAPNDRSHDDVWSHTLPHNVQVRKFDQSDHAQAILQEIKPDIVHHHHPKSTWMMKFIQGRYKRVGTCHCWDHNKNAAPWIVPICPNNVSEYRIVRHGVDIDLFKPAKRRKASKPFVIGFVGRRSIEKLPLSFVTALSEWNAPADFIVRFVGHGALNPHTEALGETLAAIPCVEMLDDVLPDEMPEQYQQMDVLVIPSENDSVSFVALEAMACGVPVVARAIEGLPDTVGNAGILIDVDIAADDDSQFFVEIEALAKDKKRFSALRKKARARAVEQFPLGKMIAGYETVYAKRTDGVVRRPKGFEVSVVVPVWNTDPAWLRESVESILSQRGVAFELVIVDDGSDRQDTLLELDRIAAENPSVVVLLHKLQGGISETLNVGIRAARADIIARHDADDIMPDGRLALQLPMMVDADVVSGQMSLLSGKPTNVLALNPAVAIEAQPWCVAHPTVMMYRYQVLSIGGYTQKGPAQDFDLWCRLQRAGAIFKVAQDEFVCYREHIDPDSIGDYTTNRIVEIAAWHDWKHKHLDPSPIAPVTWNRNIFDNARTSDLAEKPLPKKKPSIEPRTNRKSSIGGVRWKKKEIPTERTSQRGPNGAGVRWEKKKPPVEPRTSRRGGRVRWQRKSHSAKDSKTEPLSVEVKAKPKVEIVLAPRRLSLTDTPRLGMILRADHGGLARISQDFYKYIKPDKSIIIDVGHDPINLEAFPGINPEIVRYSVDPCLPNELLESWMEDLDVIVTFETPYNWALFDMARKRGIRTIMMVDYEYLDNPLPGRADVLWMPVNWHMTDIHREEGSATFIPMPIDRDRFVYRERTEAKTFVSVLGHPHLIEDRGGVKALLAAIPLVKNQDVRFILRSIQEIPQITDPRVTVDVSCKDNPEDNWTEGDIFLHPRRYAGMSLPMNEALACGLPVLMTDMIPQNTILPPHWLFAPRSVKPFKLRRTVEIAEQSPKIIAATIDNWAGRDIRVESQLANRMADAISWKRMLPAIKRMIFDE